MCALFVVLRTNVLYPLSLPQKDIRVSCRLVSRVFESVLFLWNGLLEMIIWASCFSA